MDQAPCSSHTGEPPGAPTASSRCLTALPSVPARVKAGRFPYEAMLTSITWLNFQNLGSSADFSHRVAVGTNENLSFIHSLGAWVWSAK